LIIGAENNEIYSTHTYIRPIEQRAVLCKSADLFFKVGYSTLEWNSEYEDLCGNSEQKSGRKFSLGTEKMYIE
jgi:hypothetical protein